MAREISPSVPLLLGCVKVDQWKELCVQMLCYLGDARALCLYLEI